jgi:hypothetical protein
MHAEGKKATQTSKAADNEREGVLYLNSLSKAITCTQFEIRHFFKIEASSFFVSLFIAWISIRLNKVRNPETEQKAV